MPSHNRNSYPRPRKGPRQHAEADISLVEELQSPPSNLTTDPAGDLADDAYVALVSPAQQSGGIEPLAGFDVARRYRDHTPALGSAKGDQPSTPSQEQASVKRRGWKLLWNFKRRS